MYFEHSVIVRIHSKVDMVEGMRFELVRAYTWLGRRMCESVSTGGLGVEMHVGFPRFKNVIY